MVIYLAYEFDVRSIPESKIIRIMDDYCEFTIDTLDGKDINIKDTSEWFKLQRKFIQVRKLGLRSFGFKGNTALFHW